MGTDDSCFFPSQARQHPESAFDRFHDASHRRTALLYAVRTAVCAAGESLRRRKEDVMKFTKFAAALLACTFVGAAFVGCGSDSSEAPATTEAATTQAPAATVAATPAATAAAPVEFEKAVVAESGDAILAMVDEQWYVQYWGKDTDLLTRHQGLSVRHYRRRKRRIHPCRHFLCRCKGI